MKTIKLEFDGARNQNFRFAPLGRTIRGCFDFHRIAEPNAGKLLAIWPNSIPSQRLEYDPESGQGAIVEPLHEDRFRGLREKIEATGQKLPDERQPFSLDAATFVYWSKGLVQSGDAKLIEGEFPEIKGTPQTRFHSTQQVDPLDKLTAAIERQNELQAKMIETIAKLAK